MRKHKVLEYGSVIWDPYLTRDIDELERIQRNGTRFVTGDYKSRHEGAVTNMLKNLDLPTLQDRRTNAKLVFLYKVPWSRDWSQQQILIRLLNRIDQNVKSDPSNLQTVYHKTLSTVRWQTILDHSRSQFRKPTKIEIHSLLTLLWAGTNNRRTQHAQRQLSASNKHSRPATNLAALSPMRLYQWWSCIVFIQIPMIY
jgi:hypothetical protein